MTQLPPEIAQLSDAQRRSLLARLLREKIVRSRIPLSFAQQRLWFLDQLEPNNYAYNIPLAVHLNGTPQATVLERSLNEIVRRHEILRTAFQTVNGEPIQAISPQLELSLTVIDLENQAESIVRELADREAKKPFDLTQAPLLRATLLRLDSSHQILLLTIHHIIADGWSMGILVKELAAFYEAFSHGSASTLPRLPIQYADYAVWQRQWLQGEVLESLVSYWRQQLGGSPPVLRLPSDRPPTDTVTGEGATYPLRLASEFLAQIEQLCREEGVTLFMVLLAAFKTLLYRWTGQTDILVGTDVANRQRAETESLIGFFVNLVPLRTDCSGYPTFRELLRQVRRVCVEAYAHQELPFEKLVEELKPERQKGQMPLVQVLFVLQNTPMPAFETSDLTITSIEVNDQTSKFNLGLFVGEREGNLIGTWRYRKDLFERHTIAQLSERFISLLQSITANPDTRLHQLGMTTAEERQIQNQRGGKRSQKFKKVRAKAISFSQQNLINTSYLQPTQTLPLVIEPTTAEINLAEWAQSKGEFLETELLKHGAILFRGFGIKSAVEFERVAQGICPQLFAEYGDLPREKGSKRVYGSTPYPADKAILFHNESSHLHCCPQKIWFFCLKAARQGGETPIVDGRRLYQSLDPALRSRFEQKQLLYVRNYIEGLDVSWQDFFRTEDRSVVEAYCRQTGMEFEWKNKNHLTTYSHSPAIICHPKTQEKIFFNQIQLHHVDFLDRDVRESLLSLFSVKDLPRHVFYGDGSPIEEEAIATIDELYKQEASSFSWQEGDILMLDNMRVAHGRNSYLGDRKILVTMGEMVKADLCFKSSHEGAKVIL
ncbi:MAG TPA: condensation domain-containing protein [Xenococcaceae cyanobacterium]